VSTGLPVVAKQVVQPRNISPYLGVARPVAASRCLRCRFPTHGVDRSI
jgi:hypothetical protein